MSDREQELVHAQVEVNRAVFQMNARKNPEHHSDDSLARYTDESICQHIEGAIEHLKNARRGYLEQLEIFDAD